MSLPPTPLHDDRRSLLAKAAVLAFTSAVPNGFATPAGAGELSEWLSVKDFGAKGDGLTDDGPALERMRDYMQTDRNKHYHVYFPPGHYTYSNNRWVANLGSLTVDAYGCKFQCVRTSGFTSDLRPLTTQSIFWNLGNDTYRSTLTYHTGFLFEAAPAGASTVRLLNPGDSVGFSMGVRVFFHGFDQQWAGFPYNLRYFQWNRVIAIDRSSGILTLEDKLSHDFRQDWRDNAWNPSKGEIYGRCRVMLLERPEFHYAKLLEFNGVTFLRNPNVGPGDANGLVLACERQILRDVAHDGYLWPSECRNVLYERCDFGRVAGDKLCDQIEFRGCRMRDQFNEFTGVNWLIVQDCEIENAPVRVSPRNAILRRNRIRVPMGEQYGAIRTYGSYPVRSLDCEDNEIVHDGALLFGVQSENAASLTVSAVGSANEILLDDPAGRPAVQRLERGFLVYRNDMSLFGHVTDMSWDGTRHVIAGDWRSPLQPGETLQFVNLYRLRVSRVRFSGGDRRVVGNLRAPQLVETSGASIRLTLAEPFPYSAGFERHDVLGYVTRLSVSVSEPYSGADSDPFVYVRLLGAASTQVMSYRLKMAGYAETSIGTTTPAPGATQLLALNAGQRTRTLEILYRQGGSPISGPAFQMPKLSIEADIVSL